jgi:hypothetical protein
MVTLAAATAVFAAPAVAAPARPAVAGSQCVPLQGLTQADLCVTVQPTAASIQAGRTATFAVTVSVENGLTADVTVALGAGATYASGCPVGNGSASCWIASLNLLGSPSSYQLQAQLPAASGATSVSLTATASVPTLLSWTPPQAGATVSISAPTPTPAKTTPAPAKTAPAARPTSPPSARSTTGHPGRPGHRATSPAGVGDGPTLPPIPLPSLAGTSRSVVRPGNASGLFPTISATPSPSPSPPGAAGEISAEATGFAVPLAPAGLIVALLISLGGAGLGGRQLYHRRRDGKNGET